VGARLPFVSLQDHEQLQSDHLQSRAGGDSKPTGKAKSNAKTELEKLKVSDKTCAELIKEAAKIVYQVHDEVKDEMFELELSWVGEFTDGVHKRVPEKVQVEAEKYAKSAMEEDSDSDEDMS